MYSVMLYLPLERLSNGTGQPFFYLPITPKSSINGRIFKHWEVTRKIDKEATITRVAESEEQLLHGTPMQKSSLLFYIIKRFD